LFIKTAKESKKCTESPWFADAKNLLGPNTAIEQAKYALMMDCFVRVNEKELLLRGEFAFHCSRQQNKLVTLIGC